MITLHFQLTHYNSSYVLLFHYTFNTLTSTTSSSSHNLCYVTIKDYPTLDNHKKKKSFTTIMVYISRDIHNFIVLHPNLTYSLGVLVSFLVLKCWDSDIFLRQYSSRIFVNYISLLLIIFICCLFWHVTNSMRALLYYCFLGIRALFFSTKYIWIS